MTPGERRVLEVVARRNGWDWTRKHAARILEEARVVKGNDLESID